MADFLAQGSDLDLEGLGFRMLGWVRATGYNLGV